MSILRWVRTSLSVTSRSARSYRDFKAEVLCRTKTHLLAFQRLFNSSETSEEPRQWTIFRKIRLTSEGWRWMMRISRYSTLRWTSMAIWIPYILRTQRRVRKDRSFGAGKSQVSCRPPGNVARHLSLCVKSGQSTNSWTILSLMSLWRSLRTKHTRQSIRLIWPRLMRN